MSRNIQPQRGTRNNRPPKSTFTNYNNTSNAYALNPQIEEPEIKVKKKKRKNIKKKQGLVYVRSENPGIKVSAKVYLAMGILFSCAFVCVFSVSNVKSQKMKNNMLLEKLKEEQSNTADYKIEVSNAMDLEKIEDIARNKLDMKEPESYQIRYINVPKQSYTVHFEDTGLEEEGLRSNRRLSSANILGDISKSLGLLK